MIKKQGRQKKKVTLSVRNAKKVHETFAPNGVVNSFGAKNYAWKPRGKKARKKKMRNVLTPKDCVKNVRTEDLAAFAPTHTFADFGLDARLLANVPYAQPLPIQDRAIGPILEGRDVIGLAQTGTGKTAAFLLPLLTLVMRAPRRERVLVMTPTRELAQQIHEALDTFAAGTDVRSALVVGGANVRVQERALTHNPHFVIGTPGRLHDLVERGVLALGDITRVVIDEVDRMMDMGFIKEVKYLLAHMPQRVQTLLFSATLRKEMRQVAKAFQTNPKTIAITPRPTALSVQQDLQYVDPGDDKMEILHDALIAPDVTRAIVFVRTKYDALEVCAELVDRGFRAGVVQGDLSHGARKRVVKQFRDGIIDVLVATDLVARGIDVPDVSHVINYDVPDTYDDYVHRIGRTGRAGKIGYALTLWERE